MEKLSITAFRHHILFCQGVYLTSVAKTHPGKILNGSAFEPQRKIQAEYSV